MICAPDVLVCRTCGIPRVRTSDGLVAPCAICSRLLFQPDAELLRERPAPPSFPRPKEPHR